MIPILKEELTNISNDVYGTATLVMTNDLEHDSLKHDSVGGIRRHSLRRLMSPIEGREHSSSVLGPCEELTLV